MSILLDCNKPQPSDELLTAVLTPHIMRRLSLDEEREMLLRGLLRTAYLEGRSDGITAAVKAQIAGGAL